MPSSTCFSTCYFAQVGDATRYKVQYKSRAAVINDVKKNPKQQLTSLRLKTAVLITVMYDNNSSKTFMKSKVCLNDADVQTEADYREVQLLRNS